VGHLLNNQVPLGMGKDGSYALGQQLKTDFLRRRR